MPRTGHVATARYCTSLSFEEEASVKEVQDAHTHTQRERKTLSFFSREYSRVETTRVMLAATSVGTGLAFLIALARFCLDSARELALLLLFFFFTRAYTNAAR